MQPVKWIKPDDSQNVAGPSIHQRMSPFLTLNAGCYDDLFDYLSLEDLCAIGRTCKHLQHAAGIYFKQYYSLTAIEFGVRGKNEQIILHKSYEIMQSFRTNFAPYDQRIIIHSSVIRAFHLAAMSKYQNLKEIQFNILRALTEDHYACIMKMNILDEITSLRFYFCHNEIRNELLNRILRSCVGLKFFNPLPFADSSNCDWIHQSIPTLERLEYSSLKPKALEMFLRANPQIKKVTANEIDSVLKIVQEFGMELDELEYSPDYNVDRIKNRTLKRLIALNETGDINDLQVHFRNSSRDFHQIIVALKKINCLTALRNEKKWDDDAVQHVDELVHLKKFHLDGFEILTLKADMWSKSLINLEEFYFTRASLLEVLPFARRLPKLRIIEVNRKSNEAVDLKALNNDRKMLANAWILRIYLHDEAFQEIRWTYN